MEPKIFTAVLTTLLLTQMSLQGNTKDYGPGCISVTPENTCKACYQRTQKINGQCSEKIAPTIEHCDFFSGAAIVNVCYACAPGYINIPASGVCIPIAIKNCRRAHYHLGVLDCQICDGGIPRRGKCVDFEDILPDDPSYDLIQNCEWGIHSVTESEPAACYKCKQGYYGYEEYDEEYSSCAKKDGSPGMEGCLTGGMYQGSFFCVQCDVWAGYSAYVDLDVGLRCRKNGSPVERID